MESARRMIEHRMRLLPLVFAVASLACDEARPDRLPFDDEGWTVSARPTVTIGGSDEREGYLLQQVVGATRLSDGRIVIADVGSSDLLFYDSAGAHLKTVGGAGEGPGELRRIMQLLRLPGDTLLVLSFRPGLTWFSSEGELVRSERVSWPEVFSLPCRVAETNWLALPDGSLLTVLEDNLGSAPCPPPPDPPWRSTGLVARSTALDGSFDTLGVFPATEWSFPDYRAFGRSLVLGFGDDRIFVGDTGAEEIPALDLQGDTLSAYPTPWEAVPIPPEAKRERLRRFVRSDGTVETGDPYLYPERYPRFGRLLADEVGYLWVMAYPELLEPIPAPMLALTSASALVVEEGGARWRVLDPSGRIVTEVRTPRGLFPLEIGEGHVLGVSKNEYDVHAVQLHTLVR
jgi:hypothetical protein